MMKKKKKSNSMTEPDVDTKGFRVITDKHDLRELFGIESNDNKDNDFARMFEESQTDSYQIKLLEDKKKAPAPKIQRTPTEQIKVYPPPQRELDLHGYTANDAQTAIHMFIRSAYERKLQTLRIVCGKGTHSQGKAVLPDVVEQTVLQLKRKNIVMAMNWEKKDKRKSGALIVYLMNRP